MSSWLWYMCLPIYYMHFKIFVKTFHMVKFLPHVVTLKLLFCVCDDTMTTESNMLELDSRHSDLPSFSVAWGQGLQCPEVSVPPSLTDVSLSGIARAVNALLPSESRGSGVSAETWRSIQRTAAWCHRFITWLYHLIHKLWARYLTFLIPSLLFRGKGTMRPHTFPSCVRTKYHVACRGLHMLPGTDQALSPIWLLW